jgi:dipeptidyl aminopeptidase/acylaminoacyl peptidase
MTRTVPDTPISIEQLSAIRGVVLEPPQWSADGQEVAYLSSLGGTPELWGVSAAGGYPRRLTVGLGPVAFTSFTNPRWSPDGRWIAYVSVVSGTAEVWLWPADGGPARQLTRLGAHINALSWAPDSRWLALSCNRYGAYDIYRVEVATGQAARLTDDRRYEGYPVVTPDGQQIVYVRLDETWTEHEMVVLPAAGGAGQVLVRDQDWFDYHYGQWFGYPLVSPDGQSVLFRSQRSGWLNYWRVPLAGGPPEPLCAEAAEQRDAAWAPDGRAVAYVRNDNGTLALQVLGLDGSGPRTLVSPRLGLCALPAWSPDGQQLAYLYQSPTQAQDVWVVPAAGGPPRQLSSGMLGGGFQRGLVEPEKVVYPSFDGLPIHAYLYRPPQPPPGARFPGLVLIHGGPTNQWFDAFYPEAQYFARLGYAVLMPNIRGSTGYGKAFEELNNQDWGHGDLKDVVAGVDYLKTLNDINPHKMGITGNSYGGCMTMSAVAFAPGVFQAAVVRSGYADWIAEYAEQELRNVKLLDHELGPLETSRDIYLKCSPIYSVAQATTPTFVVQGEGRPPLSWPSQASLKFFRALERHYKTVRYKGYPDEGYYIVTPKTTRQLWADMQVFLEFYL